MARRPPSSWRHLRGSASPLQQHPVPSVSLLSRRHRLLTAAALAPESKAIRPPGLADRATAAIARRGVATATRPYEPDMATTMRDALTPALLRQVRDFWFEHLDSHSSLVLPSTEDNKRWFLGGEELDRACVERFAPTLEAIRASRVTSGGDMVAALALDDPCDWLSLIILLDQMPRNCYRGDAARVAFTVFDPLARDVALAALAAGVPDREPEIRWQFAYRNWFYLPLMHSEDLATHEKAVEAYDRLAGDLGALAGEGEAAEAAADGSGGERFRDQARRVVQRDVQGALKLAAVYRDFEAKHHDIIKRFGRYPHRNRALGREPTHEEEAYLANGGETFGR